MGNVKICEYCKERITFWQSAAKVFDTDGNFVGHAHYGCAAIQPDTNEVL